eukprot:UN17670
MIKQGLFYSCKPCISHIVSLCEKHKKSCFFRFWYFWLVLYNEARFAILLCI